MNKLLTAVAACLCAAPAGAILAAPLVQTGTITGHVRDTRGKPLAYIPVEIMQTGEFAVTDKAGTYALTKEDPGVYTLTAKGNVSPAVTTPIQVVVYSSVTLSGTLEPAGTTVFDFILRPLGTQRVSPHSSFNSPLICARLFRAGKGAAESAGRCIQRQRFRGQLRAAFNGSQSVGVSFEMPRRHWGFPEYGRCGTRRTFGQAGLRCR